MTDQPTLAEIANREAEIIAEIITSWTLAGKAGKYIDFPIDWPDAVVNIIIQNLTEDGFSAIRTPAGKLSVCCLNYNKIPNIEAIC